MPLIEELRKLEARALTNIERLQDFQAFTGHSYDRYSQMVDAGHLTGTVQNVRTKTNLNVTEIAKLLLEFLDDDLLRVSLYQVIADFEDFFFDFLTLLSQNNPHGALSEQQPLTVKDVLAWPNREQLINHLIEKKLHKLSYKSVNDWFKQLDKVLGRVSPRPEDITRIAEIKATRDIFAHNGGVANDIYIGKAGNLARAEDGQPLELSRPYVYDSSDFLKHQVINLTEAACTRLGP